MMPFAIYKPSDEPVKALPTDAPYPVEHCSHCAGSGVRFQLWDDMPDEVVGSDKCPLCRGEGWQIDDAWHNDQMGDQ